MENIRRLFLSALFMLLCGVMSAQTEISGTVSDSSGETIIGATVMQKGTSHGTVTDIDGNFTLNVPAGTTLVISYVGARKWQPLRA